MLNNTFYCFREKNNLTNKLASLLIAFLLLFCNSNLHAQATLSATASSGSAYPVITAAGFAYEDPDCVHGSFGPHVTMASDAQLGKNVFVFHSHIVDDNDRCTNFDRVRMEIKGWNSATEHTQGQTAYYRWKFKLDANFIGGSSFCHIFQIKAKSGDAGAPIITITPRTDILEIIHDGGDDGTGTDLGRLTSVPLAPFKGTWVEAYVKYTSNDNGSFEITLKRISDGATLLSYSKTSGIDMWRTGSSQVNRGKWGVYRSKNSTGLRDEQVRFADFCVSESSASQCPSSIGSGKVVEVAGSSISDGAAVNQRTWNGGTNQQFQLESLGSLTSVQNARTDVSDASAASDKDEILVQNPFKQNAVIKLSLAEGGMTHLAVFDQMGRQVAVIVNGSLNAGIHTVNFEAKGFAAGIYFLKLSRNGKHTTRQLIKE